jgi:hypothetical protein
MPTTDTTATASFAPCNPSRVHEQNLAIADADKFVETSRRAGADVTYNRLRFGEHIIVTVTGAPGALRFLSERFAAP